MLWFNDRLVDEASELVALPLSDRSFLLGEGVFETLLTLGGKAVALDRHLRRLTTGAQALGISSPTLDAIAVGVTAVLQSTPDISMGRMRITLSGSSNLLITHQRYKNGVSRRGLSRTHFHLIQNHHCKK